MTQCSAGRTCLREGRKPSRPSKLRVLRRRRPRRLLEPSLRLQARRQTRLVPRLQACHQDHRQARPRQARPQTRLVPHLQVRHQTRLMPRHQDHRQARLQARHQTRLVPRL